MPAERSNTNKANNEADANIETASVIVESMAPKEFVKRKQFKRKWSCRKETNTVCTNSSKQMALSRPLERLRHLLQTKSKCRQAVLNYLRPEFKQYVERSLRQLLMRKNIILEFFSSTRKQFRTPAIIGKASTSTVTTVFDNLVSSMSAKLHSKWKRQRSFRRIIHHKLALRLLRNAVRNRWLPLPRLPAFLCPKCGLTSRRFQCLDNHICSKKVPEYKNVVQTVELGFRSRVKDALAVLERIPRPQAAIVSRLQHRYAEQQQNGRNKSITEWDTYDQQQLLKQPKTLFEITWNFVQHLHGLDQNCTLIRTKAKSSPTGKSISSITDHDYHHRQPHQPKNEAENDKELSSSAANVEQNEMQDQSFHHHHSPLSSDISKEVNSILPLMGDECEKKPTPIEKCRKEEKELPAVSSFCSSPHGIAYFCRRCSHLFGQYADWDKHLADPDEESEVMTGSCHAKIGDGPVEIQVLLGELFPMNGRLISAYRKQQQQLLNSSSPPSIKPQISSSSSTSSSQASLISRRLRRRWRCTKCSTGRFASRSEFHSHLLKCAALGAAGTDKNGAITMMEKIMTTVVATEEIGMEIAKKNGPKNGLENVNGWMMNKMIEKSEGSK